MSASPLDGDVMKSPTVKMTLTNWIVTHLVLITLTIPVTRIMAFMSAQAVSVLNMKKSVMEPRIVPMGMTKVTIVLMQLLLKLPTKLENIKPHGGYANDPTAIKNVLSHQLVTLASVVLDMNSKVTSVPAVT